MREFQKAVENWNTCADCDYYAKGNELCGHIDMEQKDESYFIIPKPARQFICAKWEHKGKDS